MPLAKPSLIDLRLPLGQAQGLEVFLCQKVKYLHRPAAATEAVVGLTIAMQVLLETQHDHLGLVEGFGACLWELLLEDALRDGD